MYNRYIPQPDGTHRRRPTPEPGQPKPKPPCPPPAPPAEPCRQPTPPCTPKAEKPCARPEKPCPPAALPAGNFLRQLLPKDLDTGDLIVILLLLLMAGDCREDKNTALLTLALYLFL